LKKELNLGIIANEAVQRVVEKCVRTQFVVA
jgi:hypothetical protein